jgi:hypothetical protein
MSAPQVPIPPSAPATAPRWASHLLLGLGAVLVPWTLWLAATLPERHVARNFDIAWSGFDIALALTLIATGAGLLRGATWTQGAAAAAATLLVCDAWFDVVTSAPGAERMTAVGMAVLAELPVAVACAMIALSASHTMHHSRRLQALTARVRHRRRGGPSRDPAAQRD